MKALIIDLSDSHAVKMLNTRITSSINILAGFYLTVEEGDDPIETVVTKLKRENLSEMPLYIIPPREFVQSQVFHFPNIPDKEIKKILPREIANATDSSQPMVFNYVKNGTIRDKQVEKQEIAAFYSDQAATVQMLKRLKSQGLNPVKIIPEIQGLKTIMELNPSLGDEKSGIVFMDFMNNKINLNIFKNKYWGLQREFAFHIGYDDDLTEEDLSRISIELNRTFQYFKQRNRIYTVEKVVLYGVNPNTKHLKTFITDNHPVAVDIASPELFNVKISYPPGLQNTEEFVMIFSVAIAVSVSLTGKNVLNLLPKDYREKEKLPRRLLGLGISAAIISAILGAGTLWLEKVKKSYDDDIAGIEKTYQSLSRDAVVIENTKQQRANYFKKNFFADLPLKFSYGAADFIRRLSLITGDNIQLTRLDIDPQSQRFGFILKGSIGAGDNIDAQAAFLRFYQELKQFDDMMDITFSTIKVNAGGENALSSQLTVNSESEEENEKKVELFFTINGEIELE